MDRKNIIRLLNGICLILKSHNNNNKNFVNKVIYNPIFYKDTFGKEFETKLDEQQNKESLTNIKIINEIILKEILNINHEKVAGNFFFNVVNIKEEKNNNLIDNEYDIPKKNFQESDVPVSSISRAFQFGSLATKLAFGSFQQILFNKKDSEGKKYKIVLNPHNAEILTQSLCKMR
jgi:hypothetical protein